MIRRALLLINPHARKGEENRAHALEKLQALGLEIIAESAEYPPSLPQLIRQYRHQVDCVIIGGGDGTINAAIEGLIDTKLPLGILPLGTANNLARNLNIPLSIEEACQVIAEGNQQKIDLGWVNGSMFLNVVGVGISTEINKTVRKEFKRRWGSLAYISTALSVLWKSRPFWADIHTNNASIRVKTSQITICNGRYYGSGLSIDPDATINDSLLDLYCIEIYRWWKVFPLFLAILRGKPSPGIHKLQAEEIKIYTRRQHSVDVDGEVSTKTPLNLRIMPQILTVIVPKFN